MRTTVPGGGEPDPPPEPAHPDVPTARGTWVGRYLVLDQLGAGGMGTVVRAYDHDLDRKVALKLVQPRGGAPAWIELATARLVREARALARVQHPNVIAVHDAGTYSGGVFIAMELVDGVDLRRWLATPRSRRAIVDVFVAAARGLAAAHAAGLIHRDVKPENIMVDAGGRVRVLDFGLARALAEPDTPAGDAAAAAPATATQTGAILGTPGYMAPEQHRAGAVDARTDVFGLCVALYEALYGAPPFDDTLAAIAAGPRPPPTGRDVPGWLHAIVVRGLAFEPAARHPSMAALADALARDPAVTRTRVLVLGGAALALAGGGAFAMDRLGTTPAAAPCAGAARRWDGVWDAPRRATVERALAATARGTAADTFALVAAALDRYRDAWIAAQTDACEATHVHHEQSAALLDRRTACLDGARARAAALIDELARADGETVDRAPEALLGLPDLAACDDLDALTGVVLPPTDPKARARLDELRVRLDRAVALGLTGKYAAGRDLTRAIAAEATAVGWAPFEAEAWRHHGVHEHKAGDFPAAAAALRHAIGAAAQAHDDTTAAAAWTDLIDTVGRGERKLDEALALRLGAEAAVTRAGARPRARASLLAVLGHVVEEQGALPAAQALQEEAFALREQVLGAEHLEVAESLLHLGSIAFKAGRFEEALTRWQRAAELRTAAQGPSHPDVAVALNNVAQALNRLGRTDEALAVTRRGLAIKETALGPDHPSVAVSLVGLGAQLTNAGRAAEAVAPLERALAIRERALGAEHADTASALNALGNAHILVGHLDEAVAIHTRALAIRERVYGPAHAHVAQTLTNLSALAREHGELAAAVAHAERAAAIYRGLHGDEHIKTLQARINVAEARCASPARADRAAGRAILAEDRPRIARVSGGDKLAVAADELAVTCRR